MIGIVTIWVLGIQEWSRSDLGDGDGLIQVLGVFDLCNGYSNVNPFTGCLCWLQFVLVVGQKLVHSHGSRCMQWVFGQFDKENGV